MLAHKPLENFRKLNFENLTSSVFSTHQTDSFCLMENNKKRKGGRPKVLAKREERIQVRTTKLEKKVIESAADQVGLSVSEFLRKLAFDLEVKERFSPEEMDLFRTLQKYSENFRRLSNYIKNTQGISPQFLADIDLLRNDIHSVVKKFK